MKSMGYTGKKLFNTVPKLYTVPNISLHYQMYKLHKIWTLQQTLQPSLYLLSNILDCLSDLTDYKSINVTLKLQIWLNMCDMCSFLESHTFRVNSLGAVSESFAVIDCQWLIDLHDCTCRSVRFMPNRFGTIFYR